MTTFLSDHELMDLIADRCPADQHEQALSYLCGCRDEHDVDNPIFNDFPEVLVNMLAVRNYQHRNVSRTDIVQKMNYREGPAGYWYADNFNIGLREVLGQALTLPRTTTGPEYRTHFDEEKLFSLRHYFRGHGTPESRARIEAAYPEECSREVTDNEADIRWGELAGKHAAVRWLAGENRQCAEDWFPFLDL
jgi:hypothetical protein